MEPEELGRTLGRMEGKLDALLKCDSHQKALLEAVTKRVGDLEISRAKLLGMIAVFGIVVTMGIEALKYLAK